MLLYFPLFKCVPMYSRLRLEVAFSELRQVGHRLPAHTLLTSCSHDVNNSPLHSSAARTRTPACKEADTPLDQEKTRMQTKNVFK